MQKRTKIYLAITTCIIIIISFILMPPLMTIYVLSFLFILFIFSIIPLCIIPPSYFLYKYRKSKKKYILLDTKGKQKSFELETGYKPTEKGKFTYKYKMWLLQKETEFNNGLQYLNVNYTSQPQAQQLIRSQTPKNYQEELKTHICPYCGAEIP